MKITKEFVKVLADDIMLELTDHEANEILKTENDILSKFEKVFLINTDGVKESHHPFEFENSFLREDNEIRTISKTELLKNAPAQKDGYVIISKVVK